MKRAALLLSIVLAVCACGSAKAPPPAAEDPSGRFRFDLLAEAQPDVDGTRASWRIGDTGVTVTIQRVATADNFDRTRTLDGVADALVTRYSLGEVEGEMIKRECRAGSERAICLDGWISRKDGAMAEMFLKRSVLVESGDGFVLIESIGDSEHAGVVERQAGLVTSTFDTGGRS